MLGCCIGVVSEHFQLEFICPTTNVFTLSSICICGVNLFWDDGTLPLLILLNYFLGINHVVVVCFSFVYVKVLCGEIDGWWLTRAYKIFLIIGVDWLEMLALHYRVT